MTEPFAGGFTGIIRRFQLTIAWCRENTALEEILSPVSATHFSRFFKERPEAVGILLWPYQCASWSPSTRLKRLRTHCALAEKLGPPFDIGVNQRVILADLSFIRGGLRLVLDQPIWFLREGGLVLNLFVDRTRMYSLAFSLNTIEDQMVATIGAIQGRSLDEAADEYKQLTKLAHGMRPRDLLFETFCSLCSYLSITRIFAVSNEDRHHLHTFFGTEGLKKHAANYNEIWEDRGGKRIDKSFYEVPAVERRRDMAEIPQKKRALYRKRYEMLGKIRTVIWTSLEAAKVCPAYAPHEQFDL